MIEKGWHANGQHHYSYERKYWIWSLGLTAAIAFGAFVSAGFSYYASSQTTEQIKLAYAQTRPWISVEPVFEGDVTIGDGETGFPIGFTLTNLGHSPAFNVDIEYEIRPYGFAEQYPDKEDNLFCSVPLASHYIPSGPWLAPGSHAFEVKNTTMFVSNTFVTRAAQTNDRLGFWVLLFGCVNYRIPGEPIIHQTPFEFQFYQWLPDHPAAMTSFKYAPLAVYPRKTLRMRQIYKDGQEPN